VLRVTGCRLIGTCFQGCRRIAFHALGVILALGKRLGRRASKTDDDAHDVVATLRVERMLQERTPGLP